MEQAPQHCTPDHVGSPCSEAHVFLWEAYEAYSLAVMWPWQPYWKTHLCQGWTEWYIAPYWQVESSFCRVSLGLCITWPELFIIRYILLCLHNKFCATGMGNSLSFINPTNFFKLVLNRSIKRQVRLLSSNYLNKAINSQIFPMALGREPPTPAVLQLKWSLVIKASGLSGI